MLDLRLTNPIEIGLGSLAVGLIGRGISASRSPEIHEHEARALGLELTYRLFDFTALDWPDESLDEAVHTLMGMGFSGCNVTHPFKKHVVDLCDTVSPEAKSLGACNTLLFDDRGIHGHNTDWIGFSWLVEREIGDIRGSVIAQIGAGGAGAATCYALARLGVSEIALYDSALSNCEELVARFAPVFPHCRFVVCNTAQTAIQGRDGVVQATPVGMAAHPGMPFDADLLVSDQWLAEIIYVPIRTQLLAATQARGIKAVNGVAMVIGQAAEALHLFTGADPDRERMLASLGVDPS